MRLVVLLSSLPALAIADSRTPSAPRATSAAATPVIGGTAAPGGKWPDAAALLFGGTQECSGTLVAPTVVITAGHCVNDGAPDQVLVGTTSLANPGGGETINVKAFFEYPDSWNTVDAGILVLEKASTVAPRAIASGWAKFDIANAATIELVGYGTTDKNGTVSTDNLMEAQSTITDFNCSMSSGCNPGGQPDGELGAGGMGVDTCPGDSGGPLYLLTDYGQFVAGITSRSYDNAQFACSEGGIYGRPDKIVDWIEKTAGVPVSRGPTPSAEPITVAAGEGAETTIAHHDPKSEKHAYAITTDSPYATAKVRDDGRVRVCAGNGVGVTSIGITVTDTNDPQREVAFSIPITIEAGNGTGCDVNDFSDGGCCDTRRDARGSIPLALAVLLVLRRRRK